MPERRLMRPWETNINLVVHNIDEQRIRRPIREELNRLRNMSKYEPLSIVRITLDQYFIIEQVIKVSNVASSATILTSRHHFEA